MQSIKASTLWTAAPICLLAGSALGQTYDQGTIDRQRLRLDDATIAPSTNGWLNDSQTNRFWAWELNSSVNDTYKHPSMQRWIHHVLEYESLNRNGTITINYSGTKGLDSQAQSIADEIVTRYNSSGNDAIADGEYAICFLNIRNLDLHDHPDDDLNDSILLWNPDRSPQPGAESWSNFVSHPETPARASVWRSNGVSLADTAIEYLTDEIVARVEAQIPSFPVPIRLFFDEERGRQHGANSLDNLGAMESVLSDTSRVYSEQMFGNYNLWDSTPTYTTALEVFTNVPLAFMLGWNDADQVYRPDNHAEIPQYVASNYVHQRPHFDFEFYPMYNLYNNILNTSTDGALEAAFDHPLTDPSWGNPKWSNYNTSVYFSSAYPKSSHTQRGVLHGTWPPHRAFGWAQSEQIGSGSIQSPVLYPPSNYHENELEGDFHPDPGIVIPTQSEKEARAWIRYSRMQLDHQIFSFPELDTIGFSAPRHIAPWVTRVGTLVYRPSVGNDLTITTKENVRDIVALCKAKGINEILFWGNPNNEHYTTDDGCNTGNTDEEKRQHNWDSTNDLLSQVYAYTLNAVWFDTGNRNLTADEVESLTFSEEHALDLAPISGPNGTQVQFSAEFDIGSITALGDQYTVICEVIDGGGPWANATYTLEIYNYKTTSYQTITDSPIEWYSNSTRRVEFSDSASDGFNGYANDWARPFDDQGLLPSGSTVYDRKKITVWKNFVLPIGSAQIGNYTQGGKMKARITAIHSIPLQIGQTTDPLRVDLIQLYETECANNNIAAASQPLLGDINNDQRIDAADLMKFMQAFVANPSSDLDLNNDGLVDINDIKHLNSLIQ